MRIAQVSAELAPFAKTGGLGDVCAALPRYLAAAGHDVRPFLPLYGNLREGRDRLTPVGFVQDVPVRLGPRTFTFSLWTTPIPGTSVPAYFVRCPALYDRAATYTADPDEHVRFAFLTVAAIEACQRMGFAPDVVHAHDWHAALAPLYLATRYAWDRALFGKTRTVLTIHNVGYQGTVAADAVDDLGLDAFRALLHQDQLARGRLSFLLHGILYANALTTVSRTHAQEMLTDEQGMGMAPYLRARASDFVGIVNGIDTAIWSPERDPHLPARYGATDLSGKEVCKRRLLEAAGLPYAATSPVLGIVSRMTAQKGFDLAFDVLPDLLAAADVRLVVLGSGDARYVSFFEGLARRFPTKASYRGGYDEPYAHGIEAGADLFLMPSRYEPCGLNQMYSLRYGTPPVVRRTGGLADTVRPFDRRTGQGTGFVFDHFTSTGLAWALREALTTWQDRAAWPRLVRNAMAEDWSWERQIRHYEALYATLTAR
jgi:starch synthase